MGKNCQYLIKKLAIIHDFISWRSAFASHQKISWVFVSGSERPVNETFKNVITEIADAACPGPCWLDQAVAVAAATKTLILSPLQSSKKSLVFVSGSERPVNEDCSCKGVDFESPWVYNDPETPSGVLRPCLCLSVVFEGCFYIFSSWNALKQSILLIFLQPSSFSDIWCVYSSPKQAVKTWFVLMAPSGVLTSFKLRSLPPLFPCLIW